MSENTEKMKLILMVSMGKELSAKTIRKTNVAIQCVQDWCDQQGNAVEVLLIFSILNAGWVCRIPERSKMVPDATTAMAKALLEELATTECRVMVCWLTDGQFMPQILRDMQSEPNGVLYRRAAELIVTPEGALGDRQRLLAQLEEYRKNPDTWAALHTDCFLSTRFENMVAEREVISQMNTLSVWTDPQEDVRLAAEANCESLASIAIPDSVTSIVNDALGCYEESCRCYGEEHPETIQAMRNLANAYDIQGDQEKARSLKDAIYTMESRMLGEQYRTEEKERAHREAEYRERKRQERSLAERSRELNGYGTQLAEGAKIKPRRNAFKAARASSPKWSLRQWLDSKKAKFAKVSDVEFSAVVPQQITKGECAMVEIAIYEQLQRQIVDNLIKNAVAPAREIIGSSQQVWKNTAIRICLSSPDLKLEDNEETQQWCGKYLVYQFPVELPRDYAKPQIRFTATVYFNDLIATKLKFTVNCHSVLSQKLAITREDVLSAFLSYASEDRAKVAAILRGMKQARPDLDVFFDQDSLRGGEEWQPRLFAEIEQRDIFYLFWSKNAKKSDWVDKEWRHALKNKGLESIEPIPLEPSTECPPPEELKSKHFNDRLLQYTR